MILKKIAKKNQKHWKVLSKQLTMAILMGTLLPANIVFAAENEDAKSASTTSTTSTSETVPVETEDLSTSDDTLVEAETNESSSNFLDLVDYLVTAERIPVSRMDTPANVTVITAEEIAANHYQSLTEALANVNGVVLNDTMLNGDERVLILMDGRRSGLGAIPSMKMIERIEIVKGGGSALYGTDAVGGIINIITKKGDHNETTVDLNTGSWRTHRYEVTNQGNDGRLGWFITGSLGRQGYQKYKDSSGEHRDNYFDNRDKNVSLRLDHTFDERNSLTFSVVHTGDYGHYERFFMGRSRGRASSETTINNVAVTYNFKEGTSTPGFLSYFNNYYFGDNMGKYWYNLQGVDYQNGWDFGQHKLIAGLEWHQTHDTNEYGGFDDKKITNTAIYVQDTVKLADKWSFVPGVRVDHYSSFGNHWSPKAAINYRPDDKTKFYGSWGRVYKAPASNQLYYYNLGMGIGDPNLRPEAGHTETIGVEHDFSDKTSMAMSFFNTKIDDAIDWVPLTPELSIVHNVHSEKRRGFETTFRQKIDNKWSYNLGYSYTHTETDGVNDHYRQPNGYRVGVSYKHGIWKANLHGIMGSGLSKDNYVSDKYAAFNCNVSCDVTDFATIYLRALNFTNQYYSHSTNKGRFFQTGVNFTF